MVRFGSRAHSENFPKNELNPFLKLPGEVVGIRVFFARVQLVKRGDHRRVKIEKCLNSSPPVKA